MTQLLIYFSIIAIIWVITIILNKRFDDDPIKDVFRQIAAVLTTIGILFFWHWI
jgi:hypothetical protein